jgi:hypothetical protein
MRGTALLSIVLLIAAAGCGEKTEPGFLEQAQQSATDSATHPGSPGGTEIVPMTSAGTTVLIALEDNRIVIQDLDRIPPGPAILTITNTGTQTHNLVVEGQGVERGLDKNLGAGENTSLDVLLQPGEYTIYCSLLDHRAKGETVKLVIKPPAAPAPTSTADPVATTTTG